MVRAALLCSVAAIALCGASSANAQGWQVIPTCLNGYTTATSDGCLGAPSGATFQQPNFFTSYALQSSQTYATRPPWNVPGVDYPVGIPSSVITAGLCDPLSGSNPTGSACNPTGSTPGLPTGCSITGGTQVTCQLSSADVVFNGWDFSLHNCVLLQTNASFTGNLTLENSKFKYGSTCATRGFMANLNGGASLTLLNNSFDADGVNYLQANHQAIGPLAWNGTTGAIAAKYNYFIHAPGRFLVSASSGNLTWQYNYHEGLTAVAVYQASISGTLMTVTSVVPGTVPILNGMTIYDGGPIQTANTKICDNITCTQTGTGTGGIGTYSISQSFNLGVGPLISNFGVHGDPLLLNFGSGSGTCSVNCTMSNFTFSYNVVFDPNNWGAVTAGITPYEGPNGLTGAVFTTLNIDHNVSVANLLQGATGAGAISMSTAGVQLAYANATTANIIANYLDPTGSFHCNTTTSGSTIGTLNFSGNVDLLDGSAITANSSLIDTACFGHQ